jgi:hypothetical protein
MLHILISNLIESIHIPHWATFLSSFAVYIWKTLLNRNVGHPGKELQVEVTSFFSHGSLTSYDIVVA